MNNKLKWLTIIFTGILVGILVGTAIPLLIQQYLFPTKGDIAIIGVSVTWDDTGLPVESFDWEYVYNGEPDVMKPIKITNIETTNVILSLSTQDHSASITSLSLTWDYDGIALEPNDYVIVKLTQTITATGDWSYTTVITATEVTT